MIPHQPPLQPLFQSFFLGGFECSTHRNMSRRRLDMIAATRHDLLAREDYAQLAEHGIRAARDGVRWHLVETSPGPLRLVRGPAADQGRGAGGHAGDLGPLPLRLAG